MGNRNSNAVWEAKYDPAHRPEPRSSRESRLKFITSKYVDRTYIQPLSPTLSPYASPDESILAAVKDNDLLATLYALALHGSPNTVDPATGLHILFLALAAGDAMATVQENELAPSPSRDLASATFPVAELLLQNGAEIPFPLPAAGLSLAAKNYLSQKTAKRLPTSVGVAGGPSGSSRDRETRDLSSLSSLRERQQREKERLQKRISAGGRLHRAPQLER